MGLLFQRINYDFDDLPWSRAAAALGISRVPVVECSVVVDYERKIKGSIITASGQKQSEA